MRETNDTEKFLGENKAIIKELRHRNERLHKMYSEEGVNFIDIWDSFTDKPDLFRQYGIYHLSPWGRDRFGDIVSHHVYTILERGNTHKSQDSLTG